LQKQLEKLDYYYAVIECDSATTAAEIYKACDGLEFERTSNVIDLSFIPDNVIPEFPAREVGGSFPSVLGLNHWLRSSCSKIDSCGFSCVQSAREIPSNYKAPTYYTSALQHSKVDLTWEAEDTHRKEVMRKYAPYLFSCNNCLLQK